MYVRVATEVPDHGRAFDLLHVPHTVVANVHVSVVRGVQIVELGLISFMHSSTSALQNGTNTSAITLPANSFCSAVSSDTGTPCKSASLPRNSTVFARASGRASLRNTSFHLARRRQRPRHTGVAEQPIFLFSVYFPLRGRYFDPFACFFDDRTRPTTAQSTLE